MKTFMKLMTLLVLVSMLAACGGAATTPTQEAETSLTPAEQWAKDNGVGPYQPETDDWEAIEAAAIAEGKVTIYANSGGIEDLFEAWEEMYPEIEFDAADTDGIDTKLQAEQESGNVIGDVWFNSDGHILF